MGAGDDVECVCHNRAPFGVPPPAPRTAETAVPPHRGYRWFSDGPQQALPISIWMTFDALNELRLGQIFINQWQHERACLHDREHICRAHFSAFGAMRVCSVNQVVRVVQAFMPSAQQILQVVVPMVCGQWSGWPS